MARRRDPRSPDLASSPFGRPDWPHCMVAPSYRRVAKSTSGTTYDRSAKRGNARATAGPRVRRARPSGRSGRTWAAAAPIIIEAFERGWPSRLFPGGVGSAFRAGRVSAVDRFDFHRYRRLRTTRSRIRGTPCRRRDGRRGGPRRYRLARVRDHAARGPEVERRRTVVGEGIVVEPYSRFELRSEQEPPVVVEAVDHVVGKARLSL